MAHTKAILRMLTISTTLAFFSGAQGVSSKIDEYLNSQMNDKEFTGEVIVGQGDELLVKKNIPVRSSVQTQANRPQQFPAASIAEQFLSVAILQLEAAGRVHLDDSVCKYLSNCPDSWKEIHVLHLLSHSSGLPDLAGFPACLDTPAEMPDSSSVITALSKSRLLFKPGSGHNESKFDYYLVSLLIEHASGQSLNAYLRQRIFSPLKMTHTEHLSRESHLSTAPNFSRMNACPEGQSHPKSIPPYFADQIYTTIDDLYVWDKALINTQFLPKSSLDKMFTPYVEGHGFGWKIVKEFDRMAVIQNADLGAISVSNRVYPDDDTRILVISGTQGASAASVSHDLGSILFGKRYPASPRPDSLYAPDSAGKLLPQRAH
jgi:CubicO group peptidase (beta-lactamase class C family)